LSQSFPAGTDENYKKKKDKMVSATSEVPEYMSAKLQLELT